MRKFLIYTETFVVIRFPADAKLATVTELCKVIYELFSLLT